MSQYVISTDVSAWSEFFIVNKIKNSIYKSVMFMKKIIQVLLFYALVFLSKLPWIGRKIKKSVGE